MRVSGKQRLLHAPLKKLKRWARYKKWVKVTELNCDMSVNDGPGRPCDGKWGDHPLIYYFVDGDKKGKCYKGKRTFRKMRDFIRDKAKS